MKKRDALSSPWEGVRLLCIKRRDNLFSPQRRSLLSPYREERHFRIQRRSLPPPSREERLSPLHKGGGLPSLYKEERHTSLYTKRRQTNKYREESVSRFYIEQADSVYVLRTECLSSLQSVSRPLLYEEEKASSFFIESRQTPARPHWQVLGPKQIYQIY